jgi:hypothetical protein
VTWRTELSSECLLQWTQALIDHRPGVALPGVAVKSSVLGGELPGLVSEDGVDGWLVALGVFGDADQTNRSTTPLDSEHLDRRLADHPRMLSSCVHRSFPVNTPTRSLPGWSKGRAGKRHQGQRPSLPLPAKQPPAHEDHELLLE